MSLAPIEIWLCCDRDRTFTVQLVTEAPAEIRDSADKSSNRFFSRSYTMKFTTAFVFGGIVTTAVLGAMAPAMAYCPPQQQAVVRTTTVSRPVQSPVYNNVNRTVVRQRTVVVPANRGW
ncbi:MAG: hypothetical protein AAGM36_16620 [Cyanobacteria bacterium J06597_1]